MVCACLPDDMPANHAILRYVHDAIACGKAAPGFRDTTGVHKKNWAVSEDDRLMSMAKKTGIDFLFSGSVSNSVVTEFDIVAMAMKEQDLFILSENDALRLSSREGVAVSGDRMEGEGWILGLEIFNVFNAVAQMQNHLHIIVEHLYDRGH